MTLSLCLTLQNVVQTQKCEPCQLNKRSTPFPAGGFPLSTATSTSTRLGAQTWSQFNYHALDKYNYTQYTTDEFNVIPKTQQMSLKSYPNTADEFNVIPKTQQMSLASFSRAYYVNISDAQNLVNVFYSNFFCSMIFNKVYF